MRFKLLQKISRRQFLVGGTAMAVLIGGVGLGLVCLTIFPNPVQSPLQRAYLRWVPGDKSGSLVLFQSLTSLSRSNSLLLNSSMSAQLLTNGQPLAELRLSAKAPLELQANGGSVATPFHQDLYFVGELAMPGNSIKTATDVKLTDEKIYFKLNTVPAQLNLNLDHVIGQWYQTPLIASNSAKTPLSSTDQQKISQAFVQLWQQANVGSATAQTEQGQSVYVLQVALPRIAIQAYLQQVLMIESQTRPDQKPEITQAWLNWLIQAAAPLSDLHGEIWVDRQSLRPIHFAGSIVYLNTQTKKTDSRVGLLATLASVNQVNLDFYFEFSQFNQSFPFTEPTEAPQVSQLFTDAISKLQTGNSQSGVGTTELPTLTPYQQLQLQRLNSITPAQKQHFLDQLDKIGPLSTSSATQP